MALMNECSRMNIHTYIHCTYTYIPHTHILHLHKHIHYTYTYITLAHTHILHICIHTHYTYTYRYIHQVSGISGCLGTYYESKGDFVLTLLPPPPVCGYHMPVHTGITQCYTVLGLNAEATAPMMTNTFYKITAR